ncbi:MAG: glycosyltransferase [Clostridia bacterium]|nr:glycosyltransferase [Clostridia bacterium]
MEKPEISVIVPVFNAGKYLQECVESVISQSFSKWELLLIDDGSTDGSGAVCDEYAERDQRIRVFHKENGGVSTARNLGLDNAQGEWISFLDADDYFPKDALKALHGKAAAGADMVIGTMLHLDNGQLLYRDDMPSGRSDKVLQSVTRLSSCGCLFKTQIINDHSLRFIEGMAHAEDCVFTGYYASYSRTMEVVQAPVYIYRMNDASACHITDNAEKSPHLFKAASHLYQLAQSYIEVDKQNYMSVLRRCHIILKRGIFGMIEEGVTRDEFSFLLRCYKEFFGDSKEMLRFLYVNLPKCYAILKIQHFPKLKRMAKHLLGKRDVPLRLYGEIHTTEG